MNQCKNYCHTKLIWCDRKNCLNRSDIAKEWEKKKKDKESRGYSPNRVSSKFKISLAVITSPEDFKALQEKFGSIND